MLPTPGRGESSDCPVRGVLDRIGDKWSVLVVITLAERPHRFNELRRGIGEISQRMLTLTVRTLEREGLVARTIYPTTPPQVEYSLTEIGKTLLGPLNGLIEWADERHDAIRTARKAFDTRERGLTTGQSA